MLPKIIAHRGASKLAPENTMPSFQMAVLTGAEGIETDVQLTKDGVPVLIHDETLRRTTDGRGYVKDYTLKELQSLDAGTWFSKQFQGTTLLSLEEFLTWFQNKPLYLNIELKNNKIDYKGMENIVYDLLDQFQLIEQTTISTFNPTSVRRLAKIDETLDIALLTSKKRKDLISYAQKIGAKALHIKYRLLQSDLVMQAKEANMPLRVYTINHKRQMVKCIRMQCEGIFTDLPQAALRIRKEFFQHHNRK